ncbi:hypothetical protein M406DRAFT_70810 [Cryphonectria parasitica EP155]|uniref:Uncharacterized protein n=1 Tax=Cryphonectria parasitica (strain ATCC 38755 / EP155) TaxID=660469 RepID=A0A9P4Y1A7_CRYP1|nr:uncharacterized protein M406DRAFT_70810 [Cryphonectria parasitica EP155]KAF3764663.1 hypothetical protein M406DRAFT_70810 [Cryphonectria parasitica EP155]
MYTSFNQLLRALLLAILAFDLPGSLAVPLERELIERDTCTDLTSLVPLGLAVRQTGTTTPTTTIGNLLGQDTPCIPTTVDTSSLKAVISALAEAHPSRIKARNFWGTWVGKALKGAWSDIKSEIITIAVEDIAEWTGVGEWVELVLQGWKLVTSLDKKNVTVTSPDGTITKIDEFVGVHLKLRNVSSDL